MTNSNLSQISEIELIYRNKTKVCDRPKVTKSEEVYKLFNLNWNDLKINLCEEFKIMLLDRGNRCMGISTHSVGGVNGTVVDTKLIYALAIKARASGLIVAHNHPSGNLKPSNADIKLTEELCKAGKIMDIPLIDHLIITDEGYLSFVDHRLMP